eukprot:gene1084-10603_t
MENQDKEKEIGEEKPLNLVEKKKRKQRSGKKRGPQEQYIFQFKMEEPKKMKRQKNQQNYVKQENPAILPQIQQQQQQQQQQPNYLLNNENEIMDLFKQPKTNHKNELFSNSYERGDSDKLSLNLSFNQDGVEDNEEEGEEGEEDDERLEPKSLLPQGENNNIITSLISNLLQTNGKYFVTLLDGCFVSVTSHFASLVGYTVEELESTKYQNIVHPYDRNMANILIVKMLTSDCESVTHDIRIVEPSGQVNLFVEEINAVRNIHGQFQWLVYKIISQKKTIEIVSHDTMNENYLSCYSNHQTKRDKLLINFPKFTFEILLFNTLQYLFHSSQPTCFYDSESVILWNNSSFDTLFGGKNNNFIGIKATELDTIKGTAMEVLTKSILEEKPSQLECQFIPSTSDSKKVAVKCVGHKIDIQYTNDIGYLWFFTILDPVEQKEFEQSNELILSEDINVK